MWPIASHIKYMGLSIFIDTMQNIFIFFSNAAIRIKMQLLMQLREVNMHKGKCRKIPSYLLARCLVILSPPNRTFLIARWWRGALDGAIGVVSCAGFNSDFTLGFHTYLVGDGNLEERVSGITISSSAGSSSLMLFSSRYRSSNLETSPS